MAHNIKVYICKDDGSFETQSHVKLPQGFLMFLDQPKDFKNNRIVAQIETDYFCGFGEQRGVVWNNGHKIFDKWASSGVINAALKFLGVVTQNNLDEFDSLGLGEYRDYVSIALAIESNTQIKWEQKSENELIYRTDKFYFVWNEKYKIITHVTFDYKIISEEDVSSLEEAETWVKNKLKQI